MTDTNLEAPTARVPPGSAKPRHSRAGLRILASVGDLHEGKGLDYVNETSALLTRNIKAAIESYDEADAAQTRLIEDTRFLLKGGEGLTEAEATKRTTLGTQLRHTIQGEEERLLVAAKEGDVETVDELLPQHAAAADAHGMNAIHVATQHSQTHLLSKLVDHGVDINSVSHIVGSPLHVACKHASVGLAKALLDLRINPDLVLPGTMCTALHVSVAQLSVPLVSLLLQHNADTRLTNIHHCTPAKQAILYYSSLNSRSARDATVRMIQLLEAHSFTGLRRKSRSLGSAITALSTLTETPLAAPTISYAECSSPTRRVFMSDIYTSLSRSGQVSLPPLPSPPLPNR